MYDKQTRDFQRWALWLPPYRFHRVQALIWRMHQKGVL